MSSDDGMSALPSRSSTTMARSEHLVAKCASVAPAVVTATVRPVSHWKSGLP